MGSAHRLRRSAVLHFVNAHLLYDGARFFILLWQLRQMARQMSFDLALGFHDKSQTMRITDPSCDSADRICPCIPKRIQYTWTRAQLLQSLGSPR